MGLSMLGYIIMARLLGPEYYGELALALSLQAIIITVLSLGADQLLVRNLSIGGEEGQKFLGCVVIFRATACLLFAIVATAYYTLFNNQILSPLSWIICCSAMYAPLLVIESILQSEHQLRLVVQIKLLFFVVGLIARILVVVNQCPLVYLAIIINLEILISYGVMFLLRANLMPSRIELPGFKNVVSFFRDCVPLLVSALAVVLYMRSDQVMLGMYSTTSQVGIFSAAVKITEMFYFIPMTIFSVQLPMMSRRYRDDKEEYAKSMSGMMAIMGLGSLLVASVLATTSYFLMPSILGGQYIQSGRVASLYAFTLVFVSLGVVRAFHLTVIGKTHFLMWFTIIGLAVNFALNYLLIPSYGAMGATIATLAAQIVGGCLSSFFFDVSRSIGRQQLASLLLILNPRSAYQVIRLNAAKVLGEG